MTRPPTMRQPTTGRGAARAVCARPAGRAAAQAKAKAEAEAKAKADEEVKLMKETRAKVKNAIRKHICVACEDSTVDRVEGELFDAAKGDKSKFVSILKKLMEAIKADELIKEKLLDSRMSVSEVLEWYQDLTS